MPDNPVTQALLAFGQAADPADYFPALLPAASALIAQDPYAFALAACLNRGARPEVVWTLPYFMRRKLGHLDPHRIHQMPPEALAALLARLPRRPRYVEAAPRTVLELTDLVVRRHGGDAALIWQGRTAHEVGRTLQSLHGVGPTIAYAALILLEVAFGLRFPDLDHRQMDIRTDAHTVRVLYRLGASPAPTPAAALQAARALHPDYPGELDGPLWVIGRRWCHPGRPACARCPLAAVCRKVGVS